MKTYYMYIDEKGSFEKGKKSFVGGCGSEEANFNTFENELGQALTTYLEPLNEKLEIDIKTENYFLDLLHYMDLSVLRDNSELRKSRFKYMGDKLNAKQAESIINITGEAFIKNKIDVFRVSGRLAMYSGPQGDYLYQLQGAIIGLIDLKMKEGFSDFRIKIATRDLNKIFGNERGQDLHAVGIDLNKFHSDYLVHLKNKIKVFYPQIQCTIDFNQMRFDKRLPFADMGLGLFEDIKKIESKNTYTLCADTYLSQIEPLPNALQTFGKGIQESKRELDFRTISILDIMRYKLIAEAEFFKLEELLAKLPEHLVGELDNTCLTFVKTYYLENKYFENSTLSTFAHNLIQLRNSKLFKTVRQAYRILFELDIHTGQAITNSWAQYNEYNLNGQKFLYQNPLEFYLEHVDVQLIYCQALFNTLDFDQAKKTIVFDTEMWLEVTKPLKSFGVQNDNLLAKLIGTQGQAYIFLADLQNSPLDMQIGFEKLEEDSSLLMPFSREHSQVINYIITYYWLQGNLPKAVEAFSGINSTLRVDNLYQITKGGSVSFPDVLSQHKNVYEFLNQLRLIALGVEIETKLTKETLVTVESLCVGLCVNRSAYPNFMLIKWLLYILKCHNIEAPEVVRQWLKDAKWESRLLELMALPIYYLVDKNECVHRLQAIQNQSLYPGEGALFQYRQSLVNGIISKTANYCEVMRLMPFYYA